MLSTKKGAEPMESIKAACPQGRVAGKNRSQREQEINILALEYVHTKNPVLASRIAKAGQGLVVSCARRILSKVKITTIEEDDCISFGNLGLLGAMWRYKGGVNFTTFALPRIVGAIKDGFRETTHIGFGRRGRVEEHFSLDAELNVQDGVTISWHDHVADPRVDLFHSLAEEERNKALNTAIRYALDFIPPREAFILRAYVMDGRTLSEIGDQMGISESRVCQLLAQGMRAAREMDALRDFLDDYPL